MNALQLQAKQNNYESELAFIILLNQQKAIIFVITLDSHTHECKIVYIKK